MLRANLQEIYHAVKHSRDSSLCLTANLAGTRIYHSTHGWGRLWSCFYGIIDRLTFHNYHLTKLKQAVIHTHQIFQKHLFSIQQDFFNYKNYLKKLGAGYRIDEDSIHAIRHRIRLWNRSTMPFAHLIREGLYPKLRTFFQLCFGGEVDLLNTWNPSSMNAIARAGDVIDLEGISQGPLPLIALKKVLKNKLLNAIDLKELDRWIKRINASPECIDSLHTALAFIVECYQRDDINLKEETARLEVFLEDHGCIVFKQPDNRHIQWRQALKNGTSLKEGGQQWVVGSLIPSKKLNGDSTLVFAGNNPLEVILVAQNKALFAMKQYRQRGHDDFGIEPAQMKIYAEGRWAVMERLQPLASRQWQSSSDETSLHPADILLLKTLSALIAQFIKQNRTPKNFGVSSLMYDQNYSLKSVNIETSPADEVRDDGFDFNALEDFVFACAANNGAVFRYLMTSSGLFSHPVGRFYHELIKNALTGDQSTIDDMAGIYKIIDPKVVVQGILLVKEILSMRDQLCLKMQQLFPEKGVKSILLEINTKLIQAHQESKACGRLYLCQGANGSMAS